MTHGYLIGVKPWLGAIKDSDVSWCSKGRPQALGIGPRLGRLPPPPECPILDGYAPHYETNA